MVHLLNKKTLFLVFIVLIKNCVCAQVGMEAPSYQDYKDPEQFEKFKKKRIIIGAWQVHKLKEEGALVVKLKTNNLLIDQLKKQGKYELALEKQLEQFAINRNTMFAYLENLTFCKIYFIYSNSSDSMLNGCRQGIFLDTNLTVDPNIKMTESFYLIAEKDFAYSSSIGFVEEQFARSVKETGNPIKMMAIVLKNKYGHQLKNPMPYSVKEVDFSTVSYPFEISYFSNDSGAVAVNFPIKRTYFIDLKNKSLPAFNKHQENGRVQTSVKLKKECSYEKLSIAVDQLNENLFETYKNYPKPDIGRVKYPIKPFLY